MEVVYHYKKLRNLTIISKKNIQHAYIKDQSVQLVDVEKNAKLCISANVKILYKNNSTYTLKNGPYHRQFLDGFFPFHLTLKITYPASLLTYSNSKPPEQKGFIITKTENALTIDTVFTGKLVTELFFRNKQ